MDIVAAEAVTALSDRTSDWKLTNGQGYILGRSRTRGHAAASRLNLQFYLWKDALGYNIHPSIATGLSPMAVIADVAAGSGIWLVDVARQYPTAQLHGFDVDVRQAPHPAMLPSNVRMSRLDLREDVPADLIGKFDYVHTRLLLLVVENGDAGPFLRNLLKMLKPGGWLQWDELDTVHAAITKADPALLTPALDELYNWSTAGGRHDWTTRLAGAMVAEGFVNATTDFVGDPLGLSRAFTDSHLLMAEEFAEGLSNLGKTDAAAKYYQLVEQAYIESAAGAALCVPRVICVAQRPL